MKNKRTIYRGKKLSEKLYKDYQDRIDILQAGLMVTIFGIAAYKLIGKNKSKK